MQIRPPRVHNRRARSLLSKVRQSCRHTSKCAQGHRGGRPNSQGLLLSSRSLRFLGGGDAPPPLEEGLLLLLGQLIFGRSLVPSGLRGTGSDRNRGVALGAQGLRPRASGSTRRATLLRPRGLVRLRLAPGSAPRTTRRSRSASRTVVVSFLTRCCSLRLGWTVASRRSTAARGDECASLGLGAGRLPGVA